MLCAAGARDKHVLRRRQSMQSSTSRGGPASLMEIHVPLTASSNDQDVALKLKWNRAVQRAPVAARMPPHTDGCCSSVAGKGYSGWLPIISMRFRGYLCLLWGVHRAHACACLGGGLRGCVFGQQHSAHAKMRVPSNLVRKTGWRSINLEHKKSGPAACMKDWSAPVAVDRGEQTCAVISV